MGNVKGYSPIVGLMGSCIKLATRDESTVYVT